ncbi:uncharacterized protein LOC128992806 [Macrosteles quadrilineatus]|uniref:uncharacterized protein LOC128992806 n=1 Tax=Macrosteles quadrilineatus TaxID=74068 RepID=UPI0023E2BF82|nr:uncharacterized protein LOC128992806 [Macrosteles quadrilineatus]
MAADIHSLKVACHNTSTSNFLDVVNGVYFIDKTLLIEDLLTELNKRKSPKKQRYIKLLAPRKFGKSTNLNMIRRFFQIPVGENGNLLNVNSSLNFQVFANNNLNIFRRKELFIKYFGTYPVIFIDLKDLINITSFEDLLVRLRYVINTSFNEHKYLLQINSLWAEHFHKDSFSLYFNPNKTNLHQYSISCSFSVLSNILHHYFKKKVMILIDDFDSFEDSVACKNEKEKNKVNTFMGILFSDILLYNKHLFRAVLSGSVNLGRLYLKKVSNSEKPYIDIADETERYSHSLWKYYGISRAELRHILQRFMNETEKITEAEDKILSSSGCNNGSYNEASHPCSVWSVMQYFSKLKPQTKI